MFFFMILLVASVTCSASLASTINVKVLRGQKALLVNNQPIQGDWDFKYSMNKEPVGTGDMKNGPYMSYLAVVIRGSIITPSPCPCLEDYCKNDYCFQVQYMSGKNENVLFDKCKVVSVKQITDEKGNPRTMYSFVAESAMIQQ